MKRITTQRDNTLLPDDSKQDKVELRGARHRTGLLSLVAIWLIAVVLGIGALETYESAPGRSAIALPQWPVASRIQLSSTRFTLLLFAHPECPCTRASLGNLAHLLAQNPGKVATYVVFPIPVGEQKQWSDSSLCRTAQQILGVTVVFDTNGAETKRFHAHTSGQTFLYDSSSHLMFNGGITSGRSHYGDNAGCDSIDSILKSKHPQFTSTPVFGCSLID